MENYFSTLEFKFVFIYVQILNWIQIFGIFILALIISVIIEVPVK